MPRAARCVGYLRAVRDILSTSKATALSVVANCSAAPGAMTNHEDRLAGAGGNRVYAFGLARCVMGEIGIGAVLAHGVAESAVEEDLRTVLPSARSHFAYGYHIECVPSRIRLVTCRLAALSCRRVRQHGCLGPTGQPRCRTRRHPGGKHAESGRTGGIRGRCRAESGGEYHAGPKSPSEHRRAGKVVDLLGAERRAGEEATGQCAEYDPLAPRDVTKALDVAIKLIGTPAEESSGSKVQPSRRGYSATW